MHSKRSWLMLIPLILILASCAGPEKLARQSRDELAAGHVQKAYEKARKALRQDPSYGPAIEAMAAAGSQLMQQHQDRVLAFAAAGDTLAASDACLRMDVFRRELADYSVSIPPDRGFAMVERRIREGGADIYYLRGLYEEEAGRPRRAYNEYLAANAILPGYRDVEERIRVTGEAAIAVVAILPWQNQTSVTGLSMELTDRIYQEVGRRITPRDFRFTVVMGRDEVYDRIPLSALDDLSREYAVQIGRELGADLVVVGRIFGLRSQNNTIDYTQTVYRPRSNQGGGQGQGIGQGQGGGQGQGRGTEEEFIQEELRIVRREMNVEIRYEFTVLDTRTGYAAATIADTVPASIATVFTNFQSQGSRRDYRLYPPGLAKADPQGARRIEQRWRERAGDWELPDFLEHAHSNREHTTYRPDDRSRLFNFRGNRPLFIGALPPEEELARVALERVWVPVLGVLRDLDRQTESAPLGDR